MANEKHVEILKQGVKVWNEWRGNHPNELPQLGKANLRKANLTGADLFQANLTYANFTKANLTKANLSGADFSVAGLHGADLSVADLTYANLTGANLTGANLIGTNLFQANLTYANLTRADLTGANLRKASFGDTVLGNTNLTNTKGLSECKYWGPSIVDHRTIQQSGRLPLSFLRGCGLPDKLIDYLPSLLNEPIQYYSCFISYSTKNEDFVNRLYADLQNKGVRCWYAPEDMKIGGKILDTIDEAIRLKDKVLLVLSEYSITSEWVEDEVTKGYAEERKRGQTVLFPVRIDDAIMESEEAWAGKLKDNRHIGDFRKWKNHDEYQKSLERLLRDLKTDQEKGTGGTE